MWWMVLAESGSPVRAERRHGSVFTQKCLWVTSSPRHSDPILRACSRRGGRRRGRPGSSLLAAAMGRGAWGLVLDEPTNHLDLPAVERLESALVGWPGALLIDTHDELLGRACTTATWRVAGGTVRT